MVSDPAHARLPIEHLIGADSQAEFVKGVIEWHQASAKRFSLAIVARRCGFASKSFIRDVIIGKKKFSPASASKFTKGLALPTALEDYLLALVARDKATTTLAIHRSEKLIAQIRNRAALSTSSAPSHLPDQSQFAAHWRYIYAALGSEARGASTSEIVSRTGLAAKVVRDGLQILSEHGLVRTEEASGRFFAQNNHLILTRLPRDHQSFPRFFAEGLAKLKAASEEDFTSKRHLMFASAFSISEKNLPQIRERVHDAILKIIDDVEEGDGDRVVTLLAGLF